MSQKKLREDSHNWPTLTETQLTSHSTNHWLNQLSSHNSMNNNNQKDKNKIKTDKDMKNNEKNYSSSDHPLFVLLFLLL